MRNDWPDVTVSLHSCSSPEVTALVTANKADLGLAVLSPQSDGVETLPLAQLRVVAVMPTGHPLVARKVVRPKDLDGDGHYIGHVQRIDKIANGKPSPKVARPVNCTRTPDRKKPLTH